MTNTSTAVLEIMEAIEAIDVDQAAKQKFRQMVEAIATSHGYGWIERANRIAMARELLRLRVPRPLIRDRLTATFKISRPQAYRVITHAMQPG